MILSTFIRLASVRKLWMPTSELVFLIRYVGGDQAVWNMVRVIHNDSRLNRNLNPSHIQLSHIEDMV